MDTTLAAALISTTTLAATSTTGYAALLHHRLHTDATTGLANRAALRRLAGHAGRRRHGSAGLLLLDLDRFKQINDTHGHPTGTAVLIELAERLAEAAEPGEVPVRLHGDEFALWLGPLPDGQAAERIAKQRAAEVAAALAAPVHVDGLVLTVTASVGAYTAPTHRVSLSGLLAGADAAMYAAKRAGRLVRLRPVPTVGEAGESA
ncbi:diguanylate cyclase domain-containing protein [Kutzneria buriramensis]|uniref:Diguanylate cyclase (GGDEF)-like protein n=1 Tax=Kutzneria buriramensis TaxID=1045776 RepID=A0A3E0GSM5_9PSEU|nr:diguanylate cyclase [Kutzneria buriramensis]REH26006.1 diguanylate cyclase (GGDEF)-like protein [Kutzneria buriramensis]